MKTQEQIEHLGEFYQLDMEMSFAEQEDVFAVMEPVMFETFTEFSNKKVVGYPFPRSDGKIWLR